MDQLRHECQKWEHAASGSDVFCDLCVRRFLRTLTEYAAHPDVRELITEEDKLLISTGL